MEGALDFTSPSSLSLSTINRESRRAIAHHVYVHPIFPDSLCSHIAISSIIWFGKVVANDGNERRISRPLNCSIGGRFSGMIKIQK
jgi:hypothetical protein